MTFVFCEAVCDTPCVPGANLKKEIANCNSTILDLPKGHNLRAELTEYKEALEHYLDRLLVSKHEHQM